MSEWKANQYSDAMSSSTMASCSFQKTLRAQQDDFSGAHAHHHHIDSHPPPQKQMVRLHQQSKGLTVMMTWQGHNHPER
eukprot:3064987-Amphidinium_carterae.1